MRVSLYVLTALAVVDALTAAYLAFSGPFPAFTDIGSPTAYRSMYVHMPAGQVMYASFATAAVLSAIGIKRRSDRLIVYVDRLVYIGLVLSAYAFISGTVWSAESWGSPWTWDPRQTSVLLLLVVYLVYPAIRMSVEDPDRSVMLGYVYAIAGVTIVVTSVLLPAFIGAFHPSPGVAIAALPSAAKMAWGLRAVLLAGIAFLLVRGPPRALPGLVYLSVVIVGMVGISEWIAAGDVPRVVDAFVQGGSYVMVLDDGSKISVDLSSARSLLNPPLVDGRPTIVNHLVELDGGIKVLTHPGVYVNLALYGAFMILAFWILRR